MGALAAAGCAWSARGDPRYGGKWAWLARRGRSTASSWVQRAVRVDWGLSYAPFTRYNRLSNRLYNRYDNRLYRVNGALHYSSSHNRAARLWLVLFHFKRGSMLK